MITTTIVLLAGALPLKMAAMSLSKLKIDRNCDVLPIVYAITTVFSMLIGKVAGYCQL
jgi:hypothetical protein